jgi:hypothetical protein
VTDVLSTHDPEVHVISNPNTVAAREIAEDFARRALGRHATQKRDERPAPQA